MTAPTDADLVARCLARERGAWEALVDRHADLVYGIARRSGLDAGRAEDVVQDVFLALLRNLHRLRHRDRLMGWLVKASRREAWRAARRVASARARDESGSRPDRDPGPAPAEALASEEQRHIVRQAVARLDPRCRRLLDALFLRGITDYREAGEELDMPVGSIGPTRRRCLEKLVRILAELGLAAPGVSEEAPAASRESGSPPSTRGDL